MTLREKRFFAERIGELVTDRLNTNFENLLNYSFTADLEKQLDQIALGELEWKTVLDQFYSDFSGRIKAAQDSKSRHATQRSFVHIDQMFQLWASHEHPHWWHGNVFWDAKGTACRRRSGAIKPSIWFQTSR